MTGKTANLKAILRLMRKPNLLSVVRRRRPYTRCQQALHKYPNLLNRPNQLRATDSTYIPIPGSVLYMCAVLELCGRVALNWRMGSEMSSSLVVDAINSSLPSTSISTILRVSRSKTALPRLKFGARPHRIYLFFNRAFLSLSLGRGTGQRNAGFYFIVLLLDLQCAPAWGGRCAFAPSFIPGRIIDRRNTDSC